MLRVRGRLLLQTVRSHDQFNTTIYGMDDRYRGVRGDRRAEGYQVIAYPTARGCAAAYFPEANVLVPLDHTADVSGTPASKSIVIRLEPSARA